MPEKKRNTLIIRPSSAVERIGSGPRGILARMVSDALAVARSKEKALTVARFRIGNYEFCDPDYRQIMLWGKALELDPQDVVQLLEISHFEELMESASFAFKVENGAIISLVWDFNLLPLTVFEWMDGLAIRELGFKGGPTVSPQIAPRLPSLEYLHCSGISLTELDLSSVPGLTVLWCHDNQLTELDLASVPGLTKLSCQKNQFTELDIQPLKNLDLQTFICDSSITIKKRPDQNLE